MPGSYRAAREAESAAKVKQLEEAGEFKKLLQKTIAKRDTPPPLSEFEKIVMRRDLEDKLGGVARKVGSAARRIAPRAVRGVIHDLPELGVAGVILPTIFFPDEARRAREAASEAAVQKAIADSVMRGRAPPRRRVSTKPAGPPPAAPPNVPHLPDLKPGELRRVLGEPQAATQVAREAGAPRVPLPAAQRQRPSTRPPSPFRTGLGAPSRTPLATPLGTQRQTLLSPAPSAPPRAAAADLAPLRSPFRPPLPLTSAVSPGASADVSARPSTTTVRAPLTSAITAGVNSDCQCPPKRPPRPSDKVPTVKSYKRRMSQNSLDNLRRG